MESRATREASAQRNLALDVFIGDVSSPKVPLGIFHIMPLMAQLSAQTLNTAARKSCHPKFLITPRLLVPSVPIIPPIRPNSKRGSASPASLGGEPVVKVENRELEVEKWKQRK